MFRPNQPKPRAASKKSTTRPATWWALLEELSPRRCDQDTKIQRRNDLDHPWCALVSRERPEMKNKTNMAEDKEVQVLWSIPRWCLRRIAIRLVLDAREHQSQGSRTQRAAPKQKMKTHNWAGQISWGVSRWSDYNVVPCLKAVI